MKECSIRPVWDTIALLGPTASGKTSRAVQLARAIGGCEIISADSRQVYRGMDLGTGKDLDEYGDIPYHLIDVADAGSKYDLYQYVRDFNHVYEDVRGRGKYPVICGGSGLYAETVLAGVRLPDVPVNDDLRRSLEGKSLEELTEILSGMKRLHNVTDVDTVKRAVRAIEIQTYYQNHPDEAAAADRKTARPLDAKIIVVDVDRDTRRRRISERLQARLDAGMIDEVRGLLDKGIPAENLIYYGLEYKYLTLYLTGGLSRDEMVRQLEIAIHQFAKRQMTWLRGMERRGFRLHWIDGSLPPDRFVEQALATLPD